MIAAFRKYFLQWTLPVTKRIGMMHLPYTRKRVKARHYRDFEKILLPGMVLLTKTYGEASNLIIPSELKHGAIYAANGRVIEALGQGVVETDLIDFMLSKDEVVVFAPEFCEPDIGMKAAQWALLQVGTPYDYEFRSDNEAFYCFELTFAAYREAMDGNSPWTLRETLGEPTVSGDDFFRAKNKWSLIRDSRKMS